MKDVISMIIDNAERLLADAQVLAAKQSYQTAESLCILAMEECGKACLVNWKKKGLMNSNISAELRGHLSKQRVFGSYRAAIGIFSVGRVVPKEPDEASPAYDDDFKKEIAKAAHEHSFNQAMFIEMGLNEYYKQRGFYVDINDALEGVPSIATFTAEGFSATLNLAQEHLKMAGADEITQIVTCAIYQAPSLLKKLNSKERQQALEQVLKFFGPWSAVHAHVGIMLSSKSGDLQDHTGLCPE
jgi:AbiV family abortive infection protein